ncbi:MAG: NAD(P)/FAD-dependent oxidoreductase, partial [Advenella sp.]
LGEFVGLHVPVEPNQGQVMIGERCAPFLSYPTMHVRQTNEGTIQIGDSLEDVGYDDTTRLSLQQGIAQRAIDYFPALADMRIIRCWAALRIMSPDGMPIYQESSDMPGAYVVTCHSGITLAANHVFTIPEWILRGNATQTIAPFSNQRFCNLNRDQS